MSSREEYFLQTAVTPDTSKLHVKDVLNGRELDQYQREHGPIPEKFRVSEATADKFWGIMEKGGALYLRDGSVYRGLACTDDIKVDVDEESLAA